MEGTGAEVEFYQYVISIIWKAVHVCLGALSWLLQCVQAVGIMWLPFSKKNKGNAGCWLHSHCCLFPHQFWAGSKKYAVAVAVQHPGYIVGILSLWQDCCYYRATTRTRNKLYCIYLPIISWTMIWYFSEYIYIYSACGGVLEGDDGLLSGWD